MNINMENTTNEAVLQEQLPEQEVAETSNETQSDEQSTLVEDPKSELEKLIELRTGLFDLNLEIEDLKWLKNTCNSKFEFKGPNEAFMLINAYLGLDAAIQNATATKNKKATAIKLSAATIEALAVLVNRYSGAGIAAAQKIFRVAVAFQQPISIMRELDSQIKAIETALSSENLAKEEAE